MQFVVLLALVLHVLPDHVLISMLAHYFRHVVDWHRLHQKMHMILVCSNL